MLLFILSDFEMATRHIILIALSVSVWNEVTLVEADDTCKIHADCANNYIYKYCCGNVPRSFDRTKRTCQLTYCLNKYCSTNSDCGDSSLCCRFNKCVNDGCFGCTKSSDCDFNHVCCKQAQISRETFCASSCVGQSCKSNDDCAGDGECCRSGKCVDTASCLAQCKSNSECNIGNYCCKKRSVWFWQDRCSATCVGEKCSSSDDCGPADECCNAAGICAKSCRRQNDKEENNSKKSSKEENIREKSSNEQSNEEDQHKKKQHDKQRNHTKPSKKPNNAPWLIPVIVTVALLMAVAVFIPVFWYYRKRRASPSYTTQVICDTYEQK